MQRRHLLHTLGAAPLMLAGAVRSQVPAAAPSGGDKGGPPPAVGTPLALPDLSLLDGRPFVAAEAEGQVLVLYWWASWCPFCAVQSPLMEALWRKQQARGLRFLGLSIDRKPDDARAYLARRSYSFPSAWVTSDIARTLPKPKGLPVTVVRGRDGRVLMGEAGQLFPEDLEQIANFL